MAPIRSTRAISALATLLAAVVLFSSTGCGFCLFDFTCGSGCCVDFRCREVKDCPVPIKPKIVSTAQDQPAATADQSGR